MKLDLAKRISETIPQCSFCQTASQYDLDGLCIAHRVLLQLVTSPFYIVDIRRGRITIACRNGIVCVEQAGSAAEIYAIYSDDFAVAARLGAEGMYSTEVEDVLSRRRFIFDPHLLGRLVECYVYEVFYDMLLAVMSMKFWLTAAWLSASSTQSASAMKFATRIGNIDVVAMWRFDNVENDRMHISLVKRGDSVLMALERCVAKWGHVLVRLVHDVARELTGLDLE